MPPFLLCRFILARQNGASDDSMIKDHRTVVKKESYKRYKRSFIEFREPGSPGVKRTKILIILFKILVQSGMGITQEKVNPKRRMRT
jgi:hypothetical protein